MPSRWSRLSKLLIGFSITAAALGQQLEKTRRARDQLTEPQKERPLVLAHGPGHLLRQRK